LARIIECVPNFCVGQDQEVILEIRKAIQNIKGVTLKCIDTGYYANRSVFTFLGDIDPMLEAAYQSIKAASECIDMRTHQGAHPRFGAIDVFPFVSIAGITDQELVPIVAEFAKNVANDFKIPTYLYEKNASTLYRKDLSKIRKGEYEGLETKMKDKQWLPDHYQNFNPKTGGMAIGVRNVLVAFNVNLETKDVVIAKNIAEEIRASGKIKWNEKGEKYRAYGLCKGVKAIGWYIRDFDKVQVSMNIFDTTLTPVHEAFETCVQLAKKQNTRITGAELIGCIPKHCLNEADTYFIEKYQLSASIAMNLNELKPFDLDKNVIDFNSFCG
jgi:glutamate formiminotransferase / formiminotetrahydrofolate cyclodeaminase